MCKPICVLLLITFLVVATLPAKDAPPGADAWDVKLQDPIDSRNTAFAIKLKDRALLQSEIRY